MAVVNPGPGNAALHLINGASIGSLATLSLTAQSSAPYSAVALISNHLLVTNRGTVVLNGFNGDNAAVLATPLTNLGTVHVTGSASFIGTFQNHGTVNIDANQVLVALNPYPNVVAFINGRSGTVSGPGTLVEKAGPSSSRAAPSPARQCSSRPQAVPSRCWVVVRPLSRSPAA